MKDVVCFRKDISAKRRVRRQNRRHPWVLPCAALLYLAAMPLLYRLIFGSFTPPIDPAMRTLLSLGIIGCALLCGEAAIVGVCRSKLDDPTLNRRTERLKLSDSAMALQYQAQYYLEWQWHTEEISYDQIRSLAYDASRLTLGVDIGAETPVQIPLYYKERDILLQELSHRTGLPVRNTAEKTLVEKRL